MTKRTNHENTSPRSSEGRLNQSATLTARVKKLYREGHTTKEIQRATGLDYPDLFRVYARAGLPTPASQEAKMNVLRVMLRNHAFSIPRLVVRLEIAPAAFYQRYLRKLKGIPKAELSSAYMDELTRMLEQCGIKEADEMIRMGCSLVDIGRKIGKPRQYAKMYILGSGQHEYWLQNRRQHERMGVGK
jgi:hypothetical protein